MDKIDMREWVASLEEVIDNKLQKWKKTVRIENGEAVQVRWQYEQTHFHIDIFWHDEEEMVHLQFMSPRTNHSYKWSGLNNNTFNKIMDRVGNLAQVAMHPVIDPTQKDRRSTD